MKETLQDLKERRSCRQFKKDRIPEEVLNQILEAGMYAPSGMGRQSGKMVVIRDPETVHTISEMNRIIRGTEEDPFYGAPMMILVLADPEVPTWQEDGSLIMGNLMNAAQALGVGSCWIHRARQEFDSEEGKALLKKWGIDERYRGIGHCALGYREGEKQAAKPRKEDYVVFA